MKDLLILRETGDIDCIIKNSKIVKLKKTLIKKNFNITSETSTQIHAKRLMPNYYHYHIQKNGLSYNNISYLNEKHFFNNKLQKEGIVFMAELFHQIMDRNKISKKKRIYLQKKWANLDKKDREIINDIILSEFGKNIYKKILKILTKEKSKTIYIKINIIYKKSNLIQKIKLIATLIKNQKKKEPYVIAFLGIDGSGKSTTIKNLNLFLNKNKIPSRISNMGIYHERTKVARFLEKIYSKIKNKKNDLKGKDNTKNYQKTSLLKNIFRLTDQYIRYKNSIKKAKKNNQKVIICDRYFYDIIFQSKLDFISKILLRLVPKPTKLFFLDVTPEESFRRKGERTPEILGEQIKKFKVEIKSLSKYAKIKTKNEKETINKVLKELNNKRFLSTID